MGRKLSTLSQYAEIKANKTDDGCTDISFSGVTLSEIAFLFRSHCPGSYMLVYDVHSEHLLTTDLDDYLDAEGFLCDALDDFGLFFLSRVDSLNAIGELSPVMTKIWFIKSPLTSEDVRRLGYIPGRSPEEINIRKKTGNLEYISLSPEGILRVSTYSPKLKEALFEFFFERTILDNERLLRPEEFDALIEGPGSLIYDTGLVVPLPADVPSADAVVNFIGWSLPSLQVAPSLNFKSTVPLFSVKRSDGMLVTSNREITTTVDYFGLMRLTGIWMGFYLSRFIPLIVATVLYFVFHFLFSGGSSGGFVDVATELVLLWCLVLLYKQI